MITSSIDCSFWNVGGDGGAEEGGRWRWAVAVEVAGLEVAYWLDGVSTIFREVLRGALNIFRRGGGGGVETRMGWNRKQ